MGNKFGLTEEFEIINLDESGSLKEQKLLILFEEEIDHINTSNSGNKYTYYRANLRSVDNSKPINCFTNGCIKIYSPIREIWNRNLSGATTNTSFKISQTINGIENETTIEIPEFHLLKSLKIIFKIFDKSKTLNEFNLNLEICKRELIISNLREDISRKEKEINFLAERYYVLTEFVGEIQNGINRIEKYAGKSLFNGYVLRGKKLYEKNQKLANSKTNNPFES